MNYLTLDLIKAHLNINADYTAEDNYLEMLGNVVEEVVEAAIDDSYDRLIEIYGEFPAPLTQAMLLLLGTYYSNRESVAFAQNMSVKHSYDYLIDLYRNYNGPTTSVLEDLDRRVRQIEEAMLKAGLGEIVGNEPIEVTVDTEEFQTKISINDIDEGEY